MNKDELLYQVDKTFRANTIEVPKVVGQYDQTKMVKEISNIEELKSDIKSLIERGFNVNKIDKADIFIGNRKLGYSYNISVAIEVAKEWGYKYVMWNDGLIIDLRGTSTGLYYNEL